MLELTHTAGKGDKERSPGWRKNYEEINFHREDNSVIRVDGFESLRPGRIRKVYGTRAEGGVAVENFDTGEVELHCGCGTAHSICECAERAEAGVDCAVEDPRPLANELSAVPPDEDGCACRHHPRRAVGND